MWIHTASERTDKLGNVKTVERLLPVFLIHRERLCGNLRAIRIARRMPGLFSASAFKITDEAKVLQLFAAFGGKLDSDFFHWNPDTRVVKVSSAYNETCGLDFGPLVETADLEDGAQRLRRDCFLPVEEIVQRVHAFMQHCLDQQADLQLARYGQEFLLGPETNLKVLQMLKHGICARADAVETDTATAHDKGAGVQFTSAQQRCRLLQQLDCKSLELQRKRKLLDDELMQTHNKKVRLRRGLNQVVESAC